jgi:hypothetical protein
MTQANINCLAGMACPLCGSLEPFELAVTIVATIYDSGVEDFDVLEWDRATTCQCSTCGHRATVAAFDAGKGGAP